MRIIDERILYSRVIEALDHFGEQSKGISYSLRLRKRNAERRKRQIREKNKERKLILRLKQNWSSFQKKKKKKIERAEINYSMTISTIVWTKNCWGKIFSKPCKEFNVTKGRRGHGSFVPLLNPYSRFLPPIFTSSSNKRRD